jgi:hypothetical protein
MPTKYHSDAAAVVLVTVLSRRNVSVVGLALGAISLAVLLWAILDLARIQQSHGGEAFQRSANALRLLVVAEMLCVAIGSGLVVWLSRGPTARPVIMAVVVWVLSLFDFVLLGMASVVPR